MLFHPRAYTDRIAQIDKAGQGKGGAARDVAPRSETLPGTDCRRNSILAMIVVQALAERQARLPVIEHDTGGESPSRRLAQLAQSAEIRRRHGRGRLPADQVAGIVGMRSCAGVAELDEMSSNIHSSGMRVFPRLI
jgi:hypothetical protein